MALKKSQLYSSLWQSCDELRGGMDASQYKDYVLTLLFMKYVSDKAHRPGEAVIVVPDGGGFAGMVRLKGDARIGEKINAIIGRLARVNDLKGVIDQADFNDESKLGTGKERQDRLSKLVGIFERLDFGANGADGDDLLGDAYEYLMRHFATESGKSKGQFYTPAEVSRVMAKVIGIGSHTRPDQTIYDPTCGSGSLLLKAASEAPRTEAGACGVQVYGQEMDNATFALARMNMFLHDCGGAVLRRGNTLAAPAFGTKRTGLKTFDFAVANPHFSTKAWSSGINPGNDPYQRFVHGIPPTKNGDYAFLLHLLASLNSTGKGAIILPHGVLFRGKKEAEIRRNLVLHGFIKGIIGLPTNLFFGTGIPACILVIDKEHACERQGIFMIDASRGYIKDGPKNRLRAQDIHRIVDVFNNQIEVPRYSRMVPVAEIASGANDYNLNIPRYVRIDETEDVHDLGAHLSGGIPNRDIDALDAYWRIFPALRQALFHGAAGRPGYSSLRGPAADVKAAIVNHEEFRRFQQNVAETFDSWCAVHRPRLGDLSADADPKLLVAALAEDLLTRFAAVPLLSRYDVYQRLMDYWDETMHDDAYLVVNAGWVAAATPRRLEGEGASRFKETPDLVVDRCKYKMDLIPPELIARRYFAAEQAEVEALELRWQAIADQVADRVADSSGDDRGGAGLLEAAVNGHGRVSASGIRERLLALADDPDADEERCALDEALALMESEARAAKALKAAKTTLDRRILDRYATLQEADIVSLVVDGKWFACLREGILEEAERLTLRLAVRVRELGERYARPLRELARDVEAYQRKVAGHLKRMGLVL